MANKKSNFPNAAAERELQEQPEFVAETIDSIMQLSKKSLPKDPAELEKRIDEYFQFCYERGYRPGIESLCLSLGCCRQTFLNWRNGVKGDSWAEICERAHQIILTFIESANLSGKLNPVSSIFLLKALGGYSDSTQIEIKRVDDYEATNLSIADIERRLSLYENEGETLDYDEGFK